MLLSSVVSLVVSAVPSAAGDCLPLRVGNPEGNYIVPGVRGAIPYRRVDGVELLLDAYVQRGGGARPAVLVVHGGGFTAGSRVAFVGQILETLTHAGFNWFSLDYRLGGAERHRHALDDVRAALAFVRCRAGEFSVDPSRIAVLGEDAGAHLAALLAAEKPPGLRAVALVGGVYERRAPAVVSAGMPPVLVVHGTADTEVPPARAVRYCEAVRAAGGACEYEPVEEGIHRAENWRPSQWGYKARLTRWLADRLDLARADHRPYLGPLRKDVVYDAERGLRLDAYVPPGSGPFPAVVLVHGGGWEAGDKVTYVTPLFEPLARAGFAWFSIDYRLTPDVRHPEQMDDLRRAVAFVRGHAARFRVDPARLAVVGESASGQMAALLATEDAALAAVVSFYGVYDFPSLVTDASPRSLLRRLFGRETLDDEARVLLERYSPLYHVAEGLSPLLLIHGTNERLWAQGVALRDRLAAAGATHELVALEGAPHGMENWEGRPEWAGYKRKLVEWLGQRLRERPRAVREAP
ncbi:MAG TPA: alpha/beta hydrolase [Vicinamibacteria bacterium]|nr:alpha/beta hydrolase [Vicinamibacteria bacterium]